MPGLRPTSLLQLHSSSSSRAAGEESWSELRSLPRRSCPPWCCVHQFPSIHSIHQRWTAVQVEWNFFTPFAFGLLSWLGLLSLRGAPGRQAHNREAKSTTNQSKPLLKAASHTNQPISSLQLADLLVLRASSWHSLAPFPFLFAKRMGSLLLA